MKELELTKGFTALVDDEDFEVVNKYKWQARVTQNTVYAQRTIYLDNGKRTSLQLHRFILGVTDPSIDVDHEDHNGLNCQRYNIRVCTTAQNMGNRLHKKNGSSQYKGVSWSKRDCRWQASIQRDGKDKHLGHFLSEKDAALAYDVAARESFGKFALTNF